MTTKSTGPESAAQGREGLQDNNASVSTPTPKKSPRALVALLAARFPRAFAVDGSRRRPLKVGIYYDLVAAAGDTFTKKKINAALHYYTSSAAYLRSSTEGAARVDLDGNPAGEVSADEAAHACERLAIIAKIKRARSNKTRAARAPPEMPKTAPAVSSGAASVASPAAPGDGIAALKSAWKARQGGAS